MANFASRIAVCGLAVTAAAQSIVVNFPANVPLGASKYIDASFPSFAIQGSSFPAYAGNASQPNIFSRNLIQGIENRTGGALVVRVGDYSNFNPSQAASVTPPQNGAGVGQKFVFGPSFYEGFQNWPNTRWVYDVPLAKINQTVPLDEAQAAVQNIGTDKLEALELGNEVDLYVKQGVRGSSWNPAAYVSQFNSYSQWLVGQLGLSGQNLFEALTLSAPHPGGVWTAQAALQAGLTDSGRVKSISLHHYENTNTTTELQNKYTSLSVDISTTLMSHGYMKAGVDKYSSDLQYMQTNYPDLQIIFGESGRYSSSGSSTDNSEGIFGAALWTADYLLYLMTQNVTRVNMQLGQAFGFVAWHPVAFGDITPAVRSPYFGHLFAADFISTSGSLQVIEAEGNDDQLAIYGGYEDGVLKRVAIINYNVWNGSGTRPTQAFAIPIPSSRAGGTVSTLTSNTGATAMGYFYWAGMSFSYTNQGVGTNAPHQPQPQYVAASNGQVTVQVGSSQAVIVDLS